MLELTLGGGIHVVIPRIPWDVGVVGVKGGEGDF